jgi:hypothetical protein
MNRNIHYENADSPGIETKIKTGRKRTVLFTASLFVLFCSVSFGQGQIYDDFEGNRSVHYGWRGGTLDTAAKNPAPGGLDTSAKCAKYTRNADKKFDNVKIILNGKLAGVSAYASYAGDALKFRMKVYTTAPAGTSVELLLGNKKGSTDFPAGTHSQFQAQTTVSGKWEELVFKFAQKPMGSMISEEEVNQLTLLFAPNSSTGDTWYFDDISGPTIIPEKTELNSASKK